MLEGDAARVNTDLDDLQRVSAADVQRVLRRYVLGAHKVTIDYRQEESARMSCSRLLERRLTRRAACCSLASAAATASRSRTRRRRRRQRRARWRSPRRASRLANGLRVIVAQREGVPLVSADAGRALGRRGRPAAAVRAGIADRGADDAGNASRRSAPELAAAAEALGGSLDSGAGWNQSIVSITVTTPKLDAALALVAEVAREPAFAPDEIERVRTQTLDALKVAYASPGTLAGLVAERLAYGAGAVRPSGERHARVAAAHPRDDLVAAAPAHLPPRQRGADPRRRHRRRCRRSRWRSAISAAGRRRPSRPPAPPRARRREQRPDGRHRRHAGRRARPASSSPSRCPRGPAASARSARCSNSVLGGGYSSRLNQEIRIKRGLSYGASSALDARREAALFRVAVQTKNESAAEVVGAGAGGDRSADERSRSGADELAARKPTLIGGFSRSVETTAGLAAAIRALVVAHRPPAELKARIGAARGRERRPTSSAMPRPTSARRGAASRSPARRAPSSAALKAAQPGLVTIGQDALDLERGDGPDAGAERRRRRVGAGRPARLGARQTLRTSTVRLLGQSCPLADGACACVARPSDSLQVPCPWPPVAPLPRPKGLPPPRPPPLPPPHRRPMPHSSCARRRPSTSPLGRPASRASSR